MLSFAARRDVNSHCVGVVLGAFLTLPMFLSNSASAALVIFSDPSGLSAEAEFTIIDPTTLEVRVRNTSTGVPKGFSNSDQILTGMSWDFGAPGNNPGDPTITGGVVFTGPNSQSLNFSIQNVGPNEEISGEYGFGNTAISGLLTNFISSNTAGTTPFGGKNLDGPSNLDGPQGGLVANPVLVPLGGLGAIQDEYIATLNLSAPIFSLDFLFANSMRIEFGSDAAFITVVPAPSAFALLALAACGPRRRRQLC